MFDEDIGDEIQALIEEVCAMNEFPQRVDDFVLDQCGFADKRGKLPAIYWAKYRDPIGRRAWVGFEELDFEAMEEEELVERVEAVVRGWT